MSLEAAPPPRTLRSERIAITGMGIILVGRSPFQIVCPDLEAFEGILLGAAPDLAQGSASLESLSAALDGTDLGCSPEAAQRLPPSDRLLLKAARQAVRDSHLEFSDPALHSAVLVANSQSHPASQVQDGRVPYGESTAERLEVLWDLSAVVMDLSEQKEPLAQGLEEARSLLLSHQVDAVLLGAVQLDPGLALPIQGAIAVMLQRRTDAMSSGERIYALIEGLAVQPTRSAAEKTDPGVQAARRALQDAGANPQQIGLVEICLPADGWRGVLSALLSHSIITEELSPAYPLSVEGLSIALGSLQASLGSMGVAAGLASLVKTALCLYRRLIPALPSKQISDLPAPESSAFYIPTEVRSWLMENSNPRLAALHATEQREAVHLVLSEETLQTDRPAPGLWQARVSLFPIAAGSFSELLANLALEKSALQSSADLTRAASACYWRYARQADAPYRLAIVGRNPTELLREMEYAEKGLPTAFARANDRNPPAAPVAEWQTPLGSTFTPRPLGATAQVAFVYPGGFNSYPGIGKDLFYLFPFLYEQVGRITSDIEDSLQAGILYPRSSRPLSKSEIEELETQINQDPIAMLISGTTLGAIFTFILDRAFELHPAFAFGYSLGEISMMFASGVWTRGDELRFRLKSSPLFYTRLAGPQNAVRAFWGLPEVDPAKEETPPPALLWSNYLLMTEPERVRQALQNEPRVYLTHINTPRQVVIGGEQQACQRVMASLRCPSLKAPFSYALHCQAMASEYDAIRRLHSLPVERIPSTQLFTAGHYGPARLTSEEIAESIALGLTHCLDFPRLVQHVYSAGARIFIELGAGSNCAKWVDETLKDQPHLAISINRRGVEDALSIVRLVAKLVSHQVPLNLQPLYRDAMYGL